MAEKTDTSYQGSEVQWFQAYLERSNEHQIMMESLDKILPAEFKRIGEGKNCLDVLGVGSGGGQKDVHMLTLLQSTLPGVPISVDIVEGSAELANNFKALVAKTPNLSTVPFSWHMMRSEDYIKQAKGAMKKFDFIHMIQMLYYVEDLTETLKFYQGLLKKNGRLMIIIITGEPSWFTLWSTFAKDLFTHLIPEIRSTKALKAQLDKMGLKYEEHLIPAEFDISECFDPESKVGRDLLNFMTVRDFYASFTPETRAAMLDVLKNKCSKQKEGKIIFNNDMSCLLVHS